MADGTTLAYKMIGDEVFSDVIVVVHGITECSAAWDPVINRLVPGRNVLAIDCGGTASRNESRPTTCSRWQAISTRCCGRSASTTP